MRFFHLITIILLLSACTPTCDNLAETIFKATVVSVTPNTLVVLAQGKRLQVDVSNAKSNQALVNFLDKEVWISGIIVNSTLIQAYEVHLTNDFN